ncbi:fumarate hydratase [Thermococcus chitonophagus]|uniref:Fumarate hydratase n=1 Tax=Thermococcus chitonophagus TaxID=54262 RepID=A0A170STR9_9EURY|nr:FumA C-terminus/TtdB family hydratase beta subunit [Thermococcus chitonophagus]ASJ16314.1 fumarate hydratase [Thermococcus chitonophagus]CUX78697.1 Fumarate hydratase class I, aerobic; L(+)-tartrate dehydratase beta subunit [Thermococcus chitonophagus]
MAVKLETPLSADDVLKLKAGDRVILSGVVYTARDLAHKRFLTQGFPFNPEGAVIYHCGPLVKDMRVVSAGPTTSARMNPYLDFIFSKGIRAVIGKGGMNPEPFKGRAVYFAFPGGAGSLASEFVKRIRRAYWEDLGMADAVWELEVEEMPLIVGIDARGRSLFI